MNQIAELLKKMAAALVDTPEAVAVVQNAPNEEGTTVFDVTIGQGELGQALGKEGRLANAMRLVIKSAARKQNLGRVLVEFKDKDKDKETEP